MESVKLEDGGVVIILDQREAKFLRHAECMITGIEGKAELITFMRKLTQMLNAAGISA
jgi:hypothetical protein